MQFASSSSPPNSVEDSQLSFFSSYTARQGAAAVAAARAVRVVASAIEFLCSFAAC